MVGEPGQRQHDPAAAGREEVVAAQLVAEKHPAAIAGSLSSIFLYDRPLDFYARLPEKYAAVTSTDVVRVAKEDVHPNQLLVVAVGDRAKIEPVLKQLNLAPVELSDPLGNVVP